MAGSGAIKAGAAFVELFTDSTKMKRGLNTASKDFAAWGAGIRKVGLGMSAAASAVALPGGIAVKQYAEFGDAIAALSAVTRATPAEMELLTAKAKDLGLTSSFSAVQVTSLMSELGKAGFNPTQILGMTDAVLNLSRATGTDATVSAGIMSSTIRQFGLDAADATRVSDTLTEAANATFSSVEGLGEGLSYAGPVAKDFGLSLEDTVALLGTLGNIGIQGSEGGTAIRRLLTTTGAEAKKLKGIFGVSFKDASGNARPLIDVLDEVNKSTKNLGSADRAEKFNDAFGLMGITGASALGRMAGSTRELKDQLVGAGGVAARTAAQMDDTLGGSFRHFMSSVNGVSLAVGGAFEPTLRSVLDTATNVTKATAKFVDQNKELVTTVAMVTAGVGAAGIAVIGLGTTLTGVGMGLGGLSSALSLVGSPLPIISGGIAATEMAANSAASAYGLLGKSITSTVTSGVGSIGKLAAGLGGKAGAALSAVTSKLKLPAAAESATYAFAGAGPSIAAPKAGAVERLMNARVIQPYAKAGGKLKTSGNLFFQAMAAPFTSARSQSAFGGAGKLVSKGLGDVSKGFQKAGKGFRFGSTDLFVGLDQAGKSFGKAGTKFSKAGLKAIGGLSGALSSKSTKNKLSKAASAAGSGLAGLGQAGLASGANVAKASLGMLSTIVSPLTSSLGSLTSVAKGGFGAAATSAIGFASSVASIAAPVVAIAAVAGLGYYLATETEIGRDAMTALGEAATTAFAWAGQAGKDLGEQAAEGFGVMRDTAVEFAGDMTTAYHGVTDAIAAGDLAMAGEVAMAGLNVVWQTGVKEVSDVWTVASTYVMQNWNDVTSAMAGYGEDFAAGMSSVWVDIKGMAFDAMNAIATKWDSISGSLADVIIDAGVASGVMKGDAGEIKQARREDTQRRQTTRETAGAASKDDRSKQKAEIEANRLAGRGGINTEQGQVATKLQDDQNKALIDHERAKEDAQAKLEKLSQDAADKADAVAIANAEAADKKAADEKDRKKLADEAGKNSEVAGKAEEEALKKEKDSHDHKVGDVTASGLVSSMNRASGVPVGAGGDKAGAGGVDPVVNPFSRTPEQLATEKAAAEAAAAAKVANDKVTRTSTPARVEAARVANEKAGELEAQTPAAKMNEAKASDLRNFMERQFGSKPNGETLAPIETPSVSGVVVPVATAETPSVADPVIPNAVVPVTTGTAPPIESPTTNGVTVPVTTQQPDAVTPPSVAPVSVPVTTQQPSVIVPRGVSPVQVPVTTAETPAVAAPSVPTATVPVSTEQPQPIEQPSVSGVTLPVTTGLAPPIVAPSVSGVSVPVTTGTAPAVAPPSTPQATVPVRTAKTPPVDVPLTPSAVVPVSTQQPAAQASTPQRNLSAVEFGNMTQPQFGSLMMPGGMPGLDGGMPPDAGSESKSEDVTLLGRVVEVLESLDQRVASGGVMTA